MITYFPHDVNARNDEKLLSLRMEMGAIGVGIYWMLLEKLATANEQRLEYNLNKLSWDLHCEWNDIKRVVECFGLFEIEEQDKCKVFYSQRLCEHAQQVESVSAKRSRAGRAGAEAKNGAQQSTAMLEPVTSGNALGTVADNKQMPNTCQANAEQIYGKCQENAEPKKRIEKNKIKENKIKEKSSSSEDAHTREEEAAEAAEEEELFDFDYWTVWENANKIVKEIDWPSGTSVFDMDKIAHQISCIDADDMRKLQEVIRSVLCQQNRNACDVMMALKMANKQRPINPMPVLYWQAIHAVKSLNSKDRDEIIRTVACSKRRWEELVKAVRECQGNEKIRQPGKFILSRVK